MANLSDKGVSWQAWVFGIMQCLIGFFFYEMHNTYKKASDEQSAINAVVTKTLYDIQSEMKLKNRDDLYRDKEAQVMQKQIENIIKRVENLENGKRR